MPDVGIYYASLREANSEESLTILVMKNRDTKTIFADAIEVNRGEDWIEQSFVS